MSWLEEAACRGMGPDLFFPMRGENATAAKAVCASCPVRQECLHEAMSLEAIRHGVWGGLAPDERRRVVGIRSTSRMRYRARCGTEGGYKRHRRAGEAPCAACLQAHAVGTAQRQERSAS